MDVIEAIEREPVRLSSVLNRIRSVLSSLGVRRCVSTARALVHFGPWRSPILTFIRCGRPRLADEQRGHVCIPPLDALGIAAAVRTDSVHVAGRISDPLLTELKAITDCLPRGEYKRIHEVDGRFAVIASHPQIWRTLRSYFRCEPVLLEATLVVTQGIGSTRGGSQNEFHFDFAGWESLNLFVYLTDVDDEDAAHQVIQRSHQAIGFRDILAGTIDEQCVKRCHPDAIATITGPAGTFFFENTEAWHRRQRRENRRVMLNLLFASHRGLLSYGRAGRADLRRRDKAWEQALAEAGAKAR